MKLRTLIPGTRRQWALPAAVGVLLGAAAGVGLTLAGRYALSEQLGVLPWLQALADSAVVIAALFAGWAALIARRSFLSQRDTSEGQMKLATSTHKSDRHHASILLAWRFKDTWESEKMLGWRSASAAGLLVRGPRGGLVGRTKIAIGEIANFIDFAGYCVRNDLLLIADAFNEFSYYWEIYWTAFGDLVTPADDDLVGLWENASWLIAEFVKLEPGGQPLTLPADDLRNFLLGERDIANTERAVLETASNPSRRTPLQTHRPPI